MSDLIHLKFQAHWGWLSILQIATIHRLLFRFLVEWGLP
jgi:hypothetical protein